jgi:hypothetical protein
MKKHKQSIEEFKESVFPDDYVPEKPKKAEKKRKTEDNDGEEGNVKQEVKEEEEGGSQQKATKKQKIRLSRLVVWNVLVVQLIFFEQASGATF